MNTFSCHIIRLKFLIFLILLKFTWLITFALEVALTSLSSGPYYFCCHQRELMWLSSSTCLCCPTWLRRPELCAAELPVEKYKGLILF